jgi:hypothetical protein
MLGLIPPFDRSPHAMIRWILLAVLVVAVSASVPIVLSALPSTEGGSTLHPATTKPTGPVGKLAFEGDRVHDFGVLAQDGHGEKSWVVKNVGEGDLEILKGATSCRCTVANFKNNESKIVLKPGESTELKITWHAKPDDNGPFAQEASIETNDPEQPKMSFRITGNVQPAISMQPPVPDFDFSTTPNDVKTPSRLALSSADKPDFKITSVTTTNPEAIETAVHPLSDAEKKQLKYENGYRVDINLLPSKALGAFNEEVIINTDHPMRPSIRVVVRGNRVGPIALAPSSIRIHDATSSDGGSKTMILTVRDREEPTKIEVEQQPEKFQVTIEPVDNKDNASKIHRYRLTATVPPGTTPGASAGVLLLKTDHPSAQQIKIPYDVAVLSGE